MERDILTQLTSIFQTINNVHYRAGFLQALCMADIITQDEWDVLTRKWDAKTPWGRLHSRKVTQ
jgi:hypothetical protein